MHCSWASADPACDTGRQKHSARCLADDGCSVSATEAARAEGARGTRRGRRDSGGEEVPGLRVPRFTAIACWITNTGNLKRPPVRSLLLFHSSTPLSNTIRYSPLLPGLFLYLFSSLFYSSSLIHYPVTEYLLWQTQDDGKCFVIDCYSGPKPELDTITPPWPVQTRSRGHMLWRNCERIDGNVSY